MVVVGGPSAPPSPYIYVKGKGTLTTSSNIYDGEGGCSLELHTSPWSGARYPSPLVGTVAPDFRSIDFARSESYEVDEATRTETIEGVLKSPGRIRS